MLAAVTAGTVGKGDVLATARIAGIMAAKRTAELIPCAIRCRWTGSRWISGCTPTGSR